MDELYRLRIARTPHPPCSPDINSCDFWMFGDCQGKLKGWHLQGSEDILEVIAE
jgi:hypothetical protein